MLTRCSARGDSVGTVKVFDAAAAIFIWTRI
jgi:hypothetical protein